MTDELLKMSLGSNNKHVEGTCLFGIEALYIYSEQQQQAKKNQERRRRGKNWHDFARMHNNKITSGLSCGIVKWKFDFF